MALVLNNPRKTKQNFFSDLFKDLTQNPITGDLALLRDEDAVKESLKNLILTDKGERLMRPLIGGNIRSMLFENITPASIKMIEVQVRSTIEEYEPRVNLIDVIVTARADENKVKVHILFYLINSDQQFSTTIFLERVR